MASLPSENKSPAKRHEPAAQRFPAIDSESTYLRAEAALTGISPDAWGTGTAIYLKYKMAFSRGDAQPTRGREIAFRCEIKDSEIKY
jgi:hypothetical protein